jgi:hypothetical protein
MNAVEAGVSFYDNDSSGFNTATAGTTFLGTETFEDNTWIGTGGNSFNDSLTQGVANSYFSNGLSVPMTVQSNLNLFDSSSPAPKGTNGLFLHNLSSGGSINSYVFANTSSNTLDLIFSPTTQITGVIFNSLMFSASGDVTVTTSVYDTNGDLLGSVDSLSNTAGTNQLGIVATAGDRIGRINLSSINGWESADNISLYSAVPEPSSLAVLGFIGLLIARRRRRD